MKQVHPNYSFNAATKTITLTGLNIDQDQLLLITNATRGVVYHNFASSSLRAVVTPGTNTTVVLTDASTSGHQNTDQLVIHYEDQSAVQQVSGTVYIDNDVSVYHPALDAITSIIGDNGNISSPEYAAQIGFMKDNLAGTQKSFEFVADNNPLPVNTGLEANVGNFSNPVATSDTGNFSLYSLFKRLLQRITALIPSGLTVTSTRLLVDSNSLTDAQLRATAVPVSVASLASAGTTGSTAPTTANLNAGTDGTNLRAISVDTNGRTRAGAGGFTLIASGSVAGNTGEIDISSYPVGTLFSLEIIITGPTYKIQHGSSIGGFHTDVTVTDIWTGVSSVNFGGGHYTFRKSLSGNIRLTYVSGSGTVPYYAIYAHSESNWNRAIPVAGQSGNITTRSSTITTGGTSQQVAASNTSRKYFAIQNISDADMYIGVGYNPTATTGILLPSGGGGFVFESGFIPTQPINVICAQSGKAFVAWEG